MTWVAPISLWSHLTSSNPKLLASVADLVAAHAEDLEAIAVAEVVTVVDSVPVVN